ncbi:MAG: ABC transporter ATP-binding protein [bacterium]|nr:ABC transporter ATP-binding protein [bacterium]
MPKISFKNFSFRYRNLQAPTLKNINLEINQGEKILIAGRSGSGKSTLMHCLNGLIPFAYDGDIDGGLLIDDMQPFKENVFEISKKVGTILQDQDSQFIGLSVAEDVAFVLENNNIPFDQMKKNVMSSLEVVGMKDFIEHSPYELSGGQKQSVSLAGILSSSADVLIFDEPLANLDPASGQNVVSLIDDLLNKTDKTILIVEHRIEDILEKNIDKIVIIEKGEIIAFDTPENILGLNVLKKAGLREPLYIEAMIHSDLDIRELGNLDDIDKLVTKNIKSKLVNWFDTQVSFNDNKTKYSEKLLSVEGLSFAYNKNEQVLDNVSFDLFKGEIISLLGSNGSGKSTLSHIIAGFLKNKKGKIYLENELINSWSIKKRGCKIGVVMQNPNHMVVKHMIRDEIALGLKAQGCDNETIESKVNEVLKICNLWGYRNWPISALSYGQKKRVTIASILTLNPKLIILDEPTAGQDYKTYTSFMAFIKKIADMGISIIMITHNIHLALEYTTRSIVLSEGKKIADDTPANIFSNKEIIEKASLKETSLGKLAEALNVNKNEFIQHFINYEMENMHCE